MSLQQTDLEIAADPSTEPEILACLEEWSDPAVREAVASNPNTPVEVLLRLGAEFPTQLLNNPLFNLLLLENPNLINRIPLKTLNSLARQKNIPIAFVIEYASRVSNRELLLKFTLDPNLPRNALERLVRVSDGKVVRAAKLHVNWSSAIEPGSEAESEEIIQAIRSQEPSPSNPQALIWLARLGAIPDVMAQALPGDDFIVEVAKSRYIRSSLARQLANNRDVEVRCAIASNPATPIDVLRQLGKDPHKTVLKALAANYSSPPNLLEALAEDKDSQIRRAVAGNPSTLPHTLQNLAQDVSSCVRQALMQNLNTPVAAIEYLSKSRPLPPEIFHNVHFWEMYGEKMAEDLSSLSVPERLGLAQSSLTPPQILDLLAENRYSPRDRQRQISMAVARNPNTRINTFIKMARHPDKNLRSEFLEGFTTNPTICPYDLFLLSQDKTFQMAVAAHPNIPLQLIETYLGTRNPEMYLALVENHSTPPHVLAHIRATIPKYNLYILRAIASHPQTPRHILEELFQIQGLHSALTNNPNLPEYLCEKLMPVGEAIDTVARRNIEPNRPDTLEWALGYFAKFGSTLLNVAILSHDRASAVFLAARANSTEWVERWAIAQNPCTPEHILGNLTQDANTIVRQNALAQLSAGIANIERQSRDR